MKTLLAALILTTSCGAPPARIERVTPACALYAYKVLPEILPTERDSDESVPESPFFDAQSDALSDLDQGTGIAEHHDHLKAARHFLACARRFEAVPATDAHRTNADVAAQICYENAIWAFANAGALAKKGHELLDEAAARDTRNAAFIRDHLAHAPSECESPPVPDKYIGATIDVDFKQAPLVDVLRIIGDTGRLNIVPLDIGDVKLDVRYKRVPWDQALDELVARAGLAYARTGNVYVIGAPPVIEPLRGTQAKTYTGQTVDLDVVDLDAATVLDFIARATGESVAARPGSGHRVKQALRRVPLDQAVELVLLGAGTTQVASATAPATVTGCAAASLPAQSLRLAAILRRGVEGWAALTDGTTTWTIKRGDCIGKDGVKVLEIGSGYVTLDGADRIEMVLHPERVSP